MRRWHRLLAPWFALLLLLLAATGLATQATDLLDRTPAKTASADAPRAKRDEELEPLVQAYPFGRDMGPVGIALNIGGGVALLSSRAPASGCI